MTNERLALRAAIRYVERNTPELVQEEIFAELLRLNSENEVLRAEAMRFRDVALNEQAARKAIESALAEMQGKTVVWHNPVATAVRDGMTGQVQLEYIGNFPADELVRLYAAPQPHHIDLVNIAVAVRDACHKAWVTSAENWRADVDVRQIVRDTHPAPAPAQAAEPVAWMFPSENGYDDSAFRDHRTVVACTGNPWTGWIPLYTHPAPAHGIGGEK